MQTVIKVEGMMCEHCVRHVREALESVEETGYGIVMPRVEDLTLDSARGYDCIIVDEAQFITKERVQLLVRIVDELNIPVICYGLRTDFQENFFEGSMWLMAWADSIEEVKTICWCGRKATCNARVMNGKVIKEGNAEEIANDPKTRKIYLGEQFKM